MARPAARSVAAIARADLFVARRTGAASTEWRGARPVGFTGTTGAGF